MRFLSARRISDSSRAVRRALREGESAGAIPVCPTKRSGCSSGAARRRLRLVDGAIPPGRWIYLAVAQEESAWFGTKKPQVRFLSARRERPGVAQEKSTSPTTTLSLVRFQSLGPCIRSKDRDTTVRTSLAEVRILPDTRSSIARAHGLPSGTTLDSKSDPQRSIRWQPASPDSPRSVGPPCGVTAAGSNPAIRHGEFSARARL